MLKRLRVKFVCITMLLVTLMLCVIFALVFQFTRLGLERESMRMMEAIGANPFHLGLPNEMPEEVRLPYFILQLSSDGKLVAMDGGYYDLSDTEFLQEVAEAAASSTAQIGILSEYNLRYFRIGTPAGQRIIFADISSEQSTLNNLLKNCLLIGVASFVVFLIISLLLARWAVKPVENAWNQQRQFVADASHELKTPLTVILTNAELLREPDYDESAKRQFSASILTMASQMRGLVESLLELARVDNGGIKNEMERLDLSQLVSDSILPFEPLYYERGLSITSQIENSISLKGSRARLRQVVEILLDNAMKYSEPHAGVHVSLKKQRSRCLLSVSNPGAAISKADQKNIFKRFYRVDKARSMNHSYGLGLPIAESIVEEHRGRIWVESENGTNTFFVELPL